MKTVDSAPAGGAEIGQVIGASAAALLATAALLYLGWAHRTGHLSSDPGVRLVSPRPRRALPTVLAPEQAAAVLDAAGTGAEEGEPLALRDLTVLELLYATGVRVAELCGLDLDDVDTARRSLRVLGKGARERTVVYGVPAAAALDCRRAGGSGGQRHHP